MKGNNPQQRDEDSGALVPASAPHLIFEIRRVDGIEAERLRIEQTRAIREVVEWVAQMRSEPGQDRAA